MPLSKAELIMSNIIDVALGILTEQRPISLSQSLVMGEHELANRSQSHLPGRLPSQNLTTELRILIAKRPHDTVYGGYWELPGGKIDPGETPAQALVREFEEELGIIVAPGEPLDEVIHTYSHASVRLIPFFCTRLSGKIQHLAVTDHLWVLPEELDGYQFPEANLPIIKEMRQILSRNQGHVPSITP